MKLSFLCLLLNCIESITQIYSSSVDTNVCNGKSRMWFNIAEQLLDDKMHLWIQGHVNNFLPYLLSAGLLCKHNLFIV